MLQPLGQLHVPTPPANHTGQRTGPPPHHSSGKQNFCLKSPLRTFSFCFRLWRRRRKTRREVPAHSRPEPPPQRVSQEMALGASPAAALPVSPLPRASHVLTAQTLAPHQTQGAHAAHLAQQQSSQERCFTAGSGQADLSPWSWEGAGGAGQHPGLQERPSTHKPHLATGCFPPDELKSHSSTELAFKSCCGFASRGKTQRIC